MTDDSMATNLGTSEDPGPQRTRAVQMMVLGTVVAVLAPLGGFLGGSMVGPARRMGDFDAMFVWMFVGLVVGGLGAILVLVGLMRWARAARGGAAEERPTTG
jgi:hypothetical protein